MICKGRRSSGFWISKRTVVDRKRFREKIWSRKRPSHKGAWDDCQSPLKWNEEIRGFYIMTEKGGNRT
jgi:hypothetical protein